MRKWYQWLGVVAVVGAAFFFQEGGFFSFLGVQPNLVLVSIVFFAFFYTSFIPLSIGSAAILFFLVLSGGFWIFPGVSLILSALIVRLLKPFFTGKGTVDFLLGVALTTILFLIGTHLTDIVGVLDTTFVKEFVYNLAVGGVVWYGITYVSRINSS